MKPNSKDSSFIFPLIKPCSSPLFDIFNNVKASRSSNKSTSNYLGSVNPSSSQSKPKDQVSVLTMTNFNKKLHSPQTNNLDKDRKKSFCSIDKYFPSVKSVKDYKRSLENYFDLQPIKPKKIKEYNISDLKLKNIEPKSYGLRNSSITFLHNDQNVGFVPRNFFYTKTLRKIEKFEINPTYSNFLSTCNLIKKRNYMDKSKQSQNNSSFDLKSLIGNRNNREDIIKQNSYKNKSVKLLKCKF